MAAPLLVMFILLLSPPPSSLYTPSSSLLNVCVFIFDSADPGAICAELKSRWEKGRIYSNVGSVLLAMNPYRNIFSDSEGGRKVSRSRCRASRFVGLGGH
jgi:hypothetical protein